MLVSIVCILLALILVKSVAGNVSAYRYRKANGLSLARRVLQSERILGLAIFRRMQRDVANGTTLQRHYENTQVDGPTMSAVVMGKKIISTSDPENIKAVLATRFKDFDLGERSVAFGPFLGRGIFTEDGVHWERSRSLIRPSFTKEQVAELPIVEEHVQNLLSRIPKDGTAVDLQRLFFNFTLDSATHFLFGQPVGSQLSPEGSEAEKFSEAFDDAQAHLQVRARAGPLRALLKDKMFDMNCQFVHSFVDRYIADTLERRRLETGGDEVKKAAGQARYNLMTELASVNTDPLQLRNELLNVLLAARDTTASLLSSVFFMLARHPNVWLKLQREITQLGGQPPSYEKLRDMSYVRAVLNETLRLFPPVPTNIRYATTHTSLPRGGGEDGSRPIFVAKGMIVHYSTWTMHRSPAIYGLDAESFRPERWLDGGNEKPLRPGWGFLPFSGGPRICLGQQKALTEAAYVVIRLLQNFERIECRDEKAWREHIGLVLSNYNGTVIALWGR